MNIFKFFIIFEYYIIDAIIGGVYMSHKVDPITLSKYIIQKMYAKGKPINHLKLQKLLYYVFAWHLVYTNDVIFDEQFEAWLHGPVLRSIWDYFKKYSTMFDILPCPKEVNIDLTEEQEEIIDDVLDEYGDKSGYYLECLTHSEIPWKNARNKGENTVVSKEDIVKYYSELLDEQ